MKICIISGTLPPLKCGVGDYTDILCNYLAKNLDIYVITSKGVNINNKNYKIYPVIEKWGIRSIRKIFSIINKIKPDVIHIQYPTISYKKNIMINILPILLKIKKYKVVMTIHEYADNSKLGKIRLYPNILFSNHIITVDKSSQYAIQKNIFFKNIKDYISFIPIGSNIPKSKIGIEDKLRLRKSILNEQEEYIMCFFGFINEKKGFETILYAMNNIKKIQNGIKTKLLLIGELSDNNNYHLRIKRIIEDLNLKENILITGYLKKEKVADYIQISDFIVLPFVDGVSPKNGSFLAGVQENKMVISTRPKEINSDLFNNIFYLDTYDDYITLSNLILRVQNQDINPKQSIVKIKEDIFNWNDIKNKHIDLYKSI